MTDEIKKLEDLRKEIDKELDELYDILTVINSLKVIFNYKETGKPYPDNEVF